MLSYHNKCVIYYIRKMFSGVVKIADIDDYLKPAQDCIKGLLEDTPKENILEEKSQNIELNIKEKRRNRIIKKKEENQSNNHMSNTNNDNIVIPNMNISNKVNLDLKTADDLKYDDLFPTNSSNKSMTKEIDNSIEKSCSKQNQKGNKKVKFTLNDCLACSGCVTTAETMLIEAH